MHLLDLLAPPTALPPPGGTRPDVAPDVLPFPVVTTLSRVVPPSGAAVRPPGSHLDTVVSGEGLAADLTLLVAPAPGSYRPITAPAQVLPDGEVVGHVEGPEGRREVRSPTDAVVLGYLARRGQSVGAGEVLVWGLRCRLDALGQR